MDVIIFGHSHKYFEEMIDGRLWLNPGGCGRPRFSQELTMAVMYIAEPFEEMFKDPKTGELRPYRVEKIRV